MKRVTSFRVAGETYDGVLLLRRVRGAKSTHMWSLLHIKVVGLACVPLSTPWKEYEGSVQRIWVGGSPAQASQSGFISRRIAQEASTKLADRLSSSHFQLHGFPPHGYQGRYLSKAAEAELRWDSKQRA